MEKQNIQLTTDSVVFRKDKETLRVLLVRRKNEPYKGMWSMPGGFLENEEDLEPGARRELEEETGLKPHTMTQFYTIGTPGRDPRGRTVSVCYYSLLGEDEPTEVQGSDDAEAAEWWDIHNLPEFAFDHKEIMQRALKQLIRDNKDAQVHSIVEDVLKKF